MKKITLPFTTEDLKQLHAKDMISLSGEIYTARDAAHKRLIQDIENNTVPFNLKGSIIYYVGPSPTPAGLTFGSAGPTTSSRMDKYTPTLLEHGVVAIIGKGYRSKEVLESFKKHQAVYLLAIGGSAAILGNCVIKSEMIAYRDLGAEAILKLTIKDFPLFVGYDIYGQDAYVYGDTIINKD